MTNKAKKTVRWLLPAIFFLLFASVIALPKPSLAREGGPLAVDE